MRDYEKYHYFAIQSQHSNLNFGFDIHSMEQIGELQDHYLVAVPVNKTLDNSKHLHKRFEEHSKIEWVEQQLPRLNTQTPGLDLNITGVWEQGITGTGVTVAFIDDGLDHDSPDLKDNFSLEGSWDYNEHKNLPTPKLYDDTHGTRCAGEVGAVKNNVCGVGVAYTSKVAGIRVLSGELTNADEAAAVNYNFQKTQIYSCSWGPRDDGRTMEGPPEIVNKAVLNGALNGRDGLGSLFLFAAGNGASSGDNCNYDGYTNSIYTMTISAMDHAQAHPIYSEECPAIILSMYSSALGMEGIYTTDWKEGCTSRHGGTSAAAPLAAGVFALVLEVRPDLSWRDAQRLAIENAIVVNEKDKDWQSTPAGRPFNHKYGYGTFDTYKIVDAAKTFTKVNPQIQYVHHSEDFADDIPQDKDGLVKTFNITQKEVEGFKRLEHVTVTVTIDHQRRGDVGIYLTSPKGFTSRLIEGRKYDDARTGFPGWTMMSVAHWDDEPVGVWTLTVTDKEHLDKKGIFKKWTLTLYGENIDGAGSSPATAVEPIQTTLAETIQTTTVETTQTTNASTILSATPETKLGNTTLSGTEQGHFSTNPVIVLPIVVTILFALGLYYAYKNNFFRKKRKFDPESFQKLNDFDENDFDALALDDLQAPREHEVLFDAEG
ncbi:pheromone processing endoprotease [Terramyces sp. JEL0728]|nr:pheromone processing endoprotease [Terramyces sp. JEL0728]